MLFSLLIAHYNNYDLFLDCYDSIVKQSYSNFEVIILDDCSTDGSFEKLTEFLKDDARFKIYQNDSNQGVGFTKKRLAELANGEVCGFLDPDDALTENAIEKSISYYDLENIVATYSLIKICDEKLNFKKVFPNTYKVKQSNPLFFNIQFEISHFFTFKKSAYQKIRGINPELQVAEDMDLYLQLYDIGAIQFIPEALYYYRIHNNGLSHTSDKMQVKQQNWHQVLLETLKRRNISKLYGKEISDITDLPKFIFEKENTFFKRILKKLR
ncbi:glycosyltransferase family 2 protein [Epilithonimonas vandammei]|uniref:Glycosyltransferase family 2 protein n=1 Tax=Epilithonimonas vandammei TaxID=2487072 RepID=A0A3G8YCT7_9FLAO|nr:glycosyltransferase family 2 protein [Epilithonimonas vandammei]AZI39011.1 glycosyltransferase family 2 protein [Epilithonimonas vandammei]